MRRFLLLSAVALASCGQPSTGDKPSAVETVEAQTGEAQLYTCPMHPHYISEDPNGSCPICGMDLVPAQASDGVLGDGSVAVSPEIIQTLGVRTERARVTDFSRELRAFGTVEANESLQASETSRLEGWISDLRVRAEGDTVRRGQLLYRIYSAELIGAQKDLLNSLRIGNPRRIASVRQRLASLGMQTGTIDRVVETGELVERVPIYAESSGTVAEIMVADGEYVRPGTPLLRLQDYGEVWVIARIPEGELPLVREGLPVTLNFPSAPDANGEGVVDYIYPTIDPATRTAQLRISLPNTDGRLRPGAYADIDFNLSRDERLSVPAEAVLRDSQGAYVIAALGEGRFIARGVTIGETAGDRTAILSGLRAGESVVVSGQFMLGSEANLRGGFAQRSQGVAFGADTPLSELPIDATTLAQIDHFTDQALYFHEALTDGYAIDPYFVDPALALVEPLRSRFGATALNDVLTQAEAALLQAKSSDTPEDLRTALAALMRALEPWLLEGAPSSYAARGVVMFEDTISGRRWLQDARPARNPYGDGGSTPVPWPDPMEGPMEGTATPSRDIDPHAGHQ